MKQKKGRPSPIIAMWLLITLAMFIFIGLSLYDDLEIGDYKLSKASFPETILTTTEPLYDEVSARNEYKEENDTDSIEIIPPVVIQPDTTVHNVLVFGDSMTHHLAMSIAKYGTKNNYKVTGVTWESSSIPGWLHSDKLQKYIEQSHPDYIIVSLGSNEMGLKSFERRIPDIRKLVEKLDTIPYIWVGPPLWKEDTGMYAVLEKALPKGKLFRTEGFYIERGPDHIHPTKKGADVWADSIMVWIGRSDHPILAEKPDSGTTTKGHRIIYLHPQD